VAALPSRHHSLFVGGLNSSSHARPLRMRLSSASCNEWLSTRLSAPSAASWRCRRKPFGGAAEFHAPPEMSTRRSRSRCAQMAFSTSLGPRSHASRRRRSPAAHCSVSASVGPLALMSSGSGNAVGRVIAGEDTESHDRHGDRHRTRSRTSHQGSHTPRRRGDSELPGQASCLGRSAERVHPSTMASSTCSIRARSAARPPCCWNASSWLC